jgi:hypothetical protein
VSETGSTLPGQYSIVPTKALWGWSTPVSGQAPVVTSYPPYGAPTKSGVLPKDLEDFIGIPLQRWSTPPVPIPTQTILNWIRYAEDEIETETNIRLCQTWIAAPPAKTAYSTQTIGLGVSGSFQNLGVDYDYSEAAYDFFFARAQDEGWLYNRMRWRPLKSVEVFQPAGQLDTANLNGVKNLSFVYPLLSEFFRMPQSWIVEDQNRGLTRYVPAVDVMMLPLFAMQLAFMGFAETVPGGLWFQYTAGLTANDYNSSWSFMKQLVLAKAAERALRGMQLSVNIGAIEFQTQADGLQYRAKYDPRGAFNGQIKEMQQESMRLLKRAKQMGGGISIGML